MVFSHNQLKLFQIFSKAWLVKNESSKAYHAQYFQEP